MKPVVVFCFVLLVGFQSNSWGQDKDRPILDETLEWTDLSGKIYELELIRDQFKSCEAIITGTFEARAPFSKNGLGVASQYFLRFKDDFNSVHGGFQTFQDDGQNWQVGVYQTDNSGNSQLRKLKPETSYAVFFPRRFDECRAICIPADEGLMACIDTWKRFGVHTSEEISAFEEQADWIVKARLIDHTRDEPSITQDVWRFEVTKTVKGEEVPELIVIRGNYRDTRKFRSR